jgi:hypothetical protein
MNIPVFDLTTNPFYVLGVTPENTHDEIAAAYDRALGEGRHSAAELTQASQALHMPQPRLEAELSWLLYEPYKSAALVQRLQAKDYAACSDMLDDMVDIDRANLAAHLCTVGAGKSAHARRMIEAYLDLDATIAAQLVARRREVSGFAKLDLGLLMPGLTNVRHAHVQGLAKYLQSRPNPVKSVLTTIHPVISRGESWYEPELYPHLTLIAADVVVASDPWLSPDLKPIRDAIAAEISLHSVDFTAAVLKKCRHAVSPSFEWMRDEVAAEMSRQGGDAGAGERALSHIGALIRHFAKSARSGGSGS